MCHSLPAAGPASLPTVPAAAAAAAAVTAAALLHPQTCFPAAAVVDCAAAAVAVVVAAVNGVRAVSVVAAGQTLCCQPGRVVLQVGLVLPCGWQPLPCAAALQSCRPALEPVVSALF